MCRTVPNRVRSGGRASTPKSSTCIRCASTVNTSSVPTLVHAVGGAPAGQLWCHTKLPCTSMRYTGVLSLEVRRW